MQTSTATSVDEMQPDHTLQGSLWNIPREALAKLVLRDCMLCGCAAGNPCHRLYSLTDVLRFSQH
jgi:hypothetical protein